MPTVPSRYFPAVVSATGPDNQPDLPAGRQNRFRCSFSITGNSCDLLFNMDELRVEATDIDQFVRFIDEYINGRFYKGRYIENLKASVITENEFIGNLRRIMTKGRSAYTISMENISGILQIEQRDFWQRFTSQVHEEI